MKAMKAKKTKGFNNKLATFCHSCAKYMWAAVAASPLISVHNIIFSAFAFLCNYWYVFCDYAETVGNQALRTSDLGSALFEKSTMKSWNLKM